MTRRPFTEEELEIVVPAWLAWEPMPSLIAKLNALPCNDDYKRNNHQVRCGCLELGLKRPQTEMRRAIIARVKKAQEKRTSAVYGDSLFKERMIEAVNKGREKAVFGVVKDHRPFVINSLRPEPNHSGCGSAAAMCMDVGSRQRL